MSIADKVALKKYRECLDDWKAAVKTGEETEFAEVCQAELTALNNYTSKRLDNWYNNNPNQISAHLAGIGAPKIPFFQDI